MFRRIFGRARREKDLEDEIRFHLQEEARLRRERGLAPDAAARETRRDFGSVALVKEVTRAMWTWTSIERILQDMRVARRSLARSPGYVAVVVVTLALGIGATTALFTIVNGVLLRPLPFRDPDRLVTVWERPPFKDGLLTIRNVVQTQNYLDWRARNRSFTAIAAIQPLPINVSGAGDAEQVPGLRVTGEFFDVLGITPIIGRGILPGEDRPGGARTVVLSYGMWQERFGGDRSIVGKRITVFGAPTEVVGVMPPAFSILATRAQLFVPLVIDPRTAPRDGRNYMTIARLRPGVSLTAAQSEMESIAAQTARERPQFNDRWSATVVSLNETTVGDIRLPLLILFGAVGCVLLIACANIVNLGLMRGAARAHEMSIRTVLGAGRGRLMHQLVVEHLIVALAGGVLGLALANEGVKAILMLFPASVPLPRAQEVRVDVFVLGFAAAVSIGIGLVVGVAPSVQAARRNVAEMLHGAGRSIASGGSRLRRALVIAEVSLAVVVVIGAGLMSRSLMRLYGLQPGYRADHVLTMRMLLQAPPGPPPQAPPTFAAIMARRAAVVNEIVDRVRSIPGVIGAGTIHSLPLGGFGSGSFWFRLDRPEPRPSEQPVAEISVVTPGYLPTMNVPIVAGRNFDRRDRIETSPHAAIVSQTLANQYFAGENPIGKSIRLYWGPSDRFEIIGVVADTRTGANHGKNNGLRQTPGPIIYLTNDQEPSGFAALVVRTGGEPLSIVNAVRAQIQSINPNQGVSDIQTMEQVVSDSIANMRLQTALLDAFAALALLLASVGLYGVVSYSVEQRRREMGVRLALGAAPGSVLRLVIGQGLWLTLAGVAIGVAGALAVTRYLAALLYEVRPTDPTVFGAVLAILFATATMACYVPARRSMAVDPATILREE